MEYSTHIRILQNLRVPYKYQLVKILYTIIEEHKGKDFNDVEDLLNDVFGK